MQERDCVNESLSPIQDLREEFSHQAVIKQVEDRQRLCWERKEWNENGYHRALSRGRIFWKEDVQKRRT